MNNSPTFQADTDAPAVLSPACVRLKENRALVTDWLAQDRADLAHPLLGRWAIHTALPVIEGLLRHPLQQPAAALALGALARTWTRPRPAGEVQPQESGVLGKVVTAVKHYPKTTLTVAALAGAAWWWSRSRPQASSFN
ncbi:hypothetical protein [Hydrogenophaga sp.]|uniref:hypothetical protein n=1 Tax=Hydrogenophaga sp. TaxID=1904254 RepID=UPI0025B9F944|nr:hypothetical protein [Hydrogenophaga sp.]